MGYQDALKAMTRGEHVRRTSWPPKYKRLSLCVSALGTGADGVAYEMGPFTVMKTDGGALSWPLNQSDTQAKDWELC